MPVWYDRSPVNSPYKDRWRMALMFSLICAWTNEWVNNRDADDLRYHRAHYDITVMFLGVYWSAVHTGSALQVCEYFNQHSLNNFRQTSCQPVGLHAGKWPDMLTSKPDTVSWIPCWPSTVSGNGLLEKPTKLVVNNIVFDSFGLCFFCFVLGWNEGNIVSLDHFYFKWGNFW